MYEAELKKLIFLIQQQYDYINEKWINDSNYFPINMKRKRVDDVYKDETLLSNIINYRNFVNDNNTNMVELIQKQNFSYPVTARVKALNSVQEKLNNYELYHEKGKIPLQKCINDIYGIRIIITEDICYEEVRSFVDKEIPEYHLKCISSIHGDYKAVHIYFGNDDNNKYQWELQIWDKKHEKINFDSHAKHKQHYTKWEKENI